MSKTIYKRTTMEKELGVVATQDWLARKASHAYEKGLKVVRIWQGTGRSKILNEVVVSKS